MPNIFKAHGIIRNSQMFSVSSFSLIISGGEEQKLFGCSKRSFYGMICVSVWTLCCSRAVETFMKGICHKTPSMGCCTSLCYKLIQGLHYDVAKMKGAVVFWLVLPGGGKTSFCGAAVQSCCLQKQGHERMEECVFDTRNPVVLLVLQANA